MLFADSFLMLSDKSAGEFSSRGSKFLAFAYPVKSEAEVKEIIQELKKQHPQAAHFCWAVVLGADGSFQKSSDDREPSGTAGKPILRAILKSKVTFTLVVVVRYFGGKLLGVPGLIEAYGEAANHALANAETQEKILFNKYFVPCSMQAQNQVILLLKRLKIKFYPSAVNNDLGIIFECRLSIVNEINGQLSQHGFKIIHLKE